MKVYVASSWRNERQQAIVKLLRLAGHDVYDFKNPRPGDKGFHWSEIDPEWKAWSPDKFRESLDHDLARDGYASDMNALEDCDACVLVMPCGRSAHLEFGWAQGAGKRTAILLSDGEPELMYRMAEFICVDEAELREVALASFDPFVHAFPEKPAPMIPCKQCVFFVKPEWRIEHETIAGVVPHSECHAHSKQVIGGPDGYDFDWPMIPDDCVGCGDGERKESPDAD